MKKQHIVTFALTLVIAGSAHAALNVSFNPAGSSRFYDHFSGSYAQLDKDTDGMYAIANIGGPNEDDLVGSAVNGFATDWSDAGTFSLDGAVTPTTTGTLDITAASDFDFNALVSGNAFSIYAGLGVGAYTTAISNIDVGSSVTLTSGVVTDLDFSADIAFTFAGFYTYEGTITISENTFSVAVDETVTASHPVFGPVPVRHQWDLTGGSTFSVVPEPSAFALIFGALAVCFVGMRRRR